MKVSIVIQARSTSTRFPGKIFEKIGTKSILQHVLDACYNSSDYINKFSHKHGIECGVAVAVPYKDKLIDSFSRNTIIEGPEDDVLKRYVIAADALDSDFVVRITSDCPFVPPYIISKAINHAVNDSLDFITNADPRYRTSPDGHDCEVMSRRMLEWLNENATESFHKEHVTSLLQDKEPIGFIIANLIGFADYSSIKLSVDTKEDLERMTAMYNSLYVKIKSSKKVYRL